MSEIVVVGAGYIGLEVAAVAVKNAKAGQIHYKNEKGGLVHAGIGKLNFSEEDLLENLKAYFVTQQNDL